MTASQGLSDAQGALGVVNGVQQGGAGGALQAANGLNKVANANGVGNSTVNSALGVANNAYGVVSGLQQGGLAGDVRAASGAAGLYTAAGGSLPSGVSAGLGAAGDVLGIANAIKNPTLGSVASGAYDAYKLYSTVSQAASAWGTGGAAATAAATGDTAAAGAAAATSAASTTASAVLTAVSSYLPMIGMASTLVAGIFSGHNDSITQVSAGQNVTQLPSGQTALQQGNLIVGAGTDRSTGSGQFFINTPSGPKGLSSSDSTMLHTYTTATDQAARGRATKSSMQSTMQDIYTRNGGQSAWGTDYNSWLASVGSLVGNISGSVWGS